MFRRIGKRMREEKGYKIYGGCAAMGGRKGEEKRKIKIFLLLLLTLDQVNALRLFDTLSKRSGES